MHVFQNVGLLSCFAVASLAGCSADSSSESAVVSGAITGSAVPGSADVTVAWMVSSGSPDYIYLFGSGELSNGSFSLSVGEPPADAVNSYGVGVGFVALFDSAASVPSGVLGDNDDQHILGLSSQHALIWIEGGAEGPPWAEAFPVGLSCGVCVAAAEGELFDSFEPIACDEVSISTPLEGVCNWT